MGDCCLYIRDARWDNPLNSVIKSHSLDESAVRVGGCLSVTRIKGQPASRLYWTADMMAECPDLLREVKGAAPRRPASQRHCERLFCSSQEQPGPHLVSTPGATWALE